MVNYNFLQSKIDLIKYPIITEKSASLFEKNQYTFIVDKSINKIEIKKLIEFLFNVKVIKVNTCLLPEKKKRLGKYIGYSRVEKKAIIKLAPENKINLFPDVYN
jgi:large subunit ribosomal protein L23